ncbi:hypothetical protein [Xanthomonas translucens]|uniref:hypothetical protein n=10 Tax=Xanthomonas campestris pv. translucens TaxID=343 RepID=UPI000A83FB44|nr:hypothetical protein [Xanthomonas translucens]MCT8283515.1 hypothetical protein [Xanthomonas translucens pv. undulosa]MCT8318295.1 hypothetical protein [Xanthomonas translucens pv. undulosa]UJB14774.1 hypothetical protein LTC53_17800 [Xanthomonas translucens pv. undulosa]UPU49892.1 hypothetical protein MZO50_05535 [Xanthomonas translucens pv. undulosa]WLA00667.1 hypothetical protein MO330_17990 [Xanthomonas translucens]
MPRYGISIVVTSAPAQDRLLHLGAAATTVLILLLLGRLLLIAPAAAPARAHDAMRLVFVPRSVAPAAPPPSQAAQSAPHAAARRAPAASRAAQAPLPPPTRTAAAVATPAASMRATLYTRDGSARLPDGVAVDPFAEAPGTPPGTTNPRDLAKAKRLLERPNPIDYRPTRFDKDWASDGTLGDVAMQGIGDAVKKMLPKNSHQPAVARPPPDVRFNPALHDRPGDLGSEATGDAYKAAPIALEKAPGLDGEASRRIRKAIGELEQRRAACPAAQRSRLLQPVLDNLGDLQRVENAMARGADPLLAQQTLPRAADSAYDLARRALWYADQKLAACAP